MSTDPDTHTDRDACTDSTARIDADSHLDPRVVSDDHPVSGVHPDSGTHPRRDRPQIALRSVVVEYEDGPDRRTMYPDGLDAVERMSTWLTADDPAFVDLDAVR